MAMSVLDATIVNIALPALAEDLGVSAAASTSAVTSYQLAVMMSLLPLAALGERIGYRGVYVAGLTLFMLSSLGCALAGNLDALTACRFAQGLGSGAMMAVNGAQLRLVWPRALLNRGIAYNGLVIGSTAAVAPVVAWAILSTGGWPWLFLVNVPLGLIAMPLVIAFVPTAPPLTRTFDGRSALLSAALFGCLFVVAADAAHGAPSARTAAFAFMAVPVAALLAQRVAASDRPLIPLDLIRMVELRRAFGASIVAFAAQACILVSLPFLIVNHLTVDTTMVGLMILPFPIGFAVASAILGRFSDWTRGRAASLVGIGVTVASFGAVVVILPSEQPPTLIAGLIGLSGAGFGCFQIPSTRVIIDRSPSTRAGAAAGMLSLCRVAGQAGGGLAAALALRLGLEAGAALLFVTLAGVWAAAFACRR